ncbi:hypothetical protein pb186bvf_008171 [Paramecium bursaria]
MEIEENIIKYTSKYLLIESFQTQISIIDTESNTQRQVNFRDAQISDLSLWKDKLVVATYEGKIYIENDHTFITLHPHSSKILDTIISDGIILTLSQDGLIKQTNLQTGVTIYQRKLSDYIKKGRFFQISNQIVVQFDLKVQLINLESDKITKFKFDLQEPLKFQINSLKKEVFSVLGSENMMLLFDINDINPIKMIQLDRYGDYYLYHNQKTNLLFYQHDGIYIYEHNQKLELIYQIQLHNLIKVIQHKQLIIIWDNISNPKLRFINSLEKGKFQALALQDQLQLFQEKPEINQKKTAQGQQQTLYHPQSIQNNQYLNIINKEPIRKQQNAIQIEDKSELMSNILKQALQTKDQEIINFAILKTKQDLIPQTINELDLQQINDLQQYIIDRIISYPYEIKSFIYWIKYLVAKGLGNMSKLFYLIEERTLHIDRLQKLCNKIKYNQLTHKPKPKSHDYRLQQHTKYVETNGEVVVREKAREIQHDEEENIQTDNLDDEFNQVYKKHQQQLRHQVLNEIEEEDISNQF